MMLVDASDPPYPSTLIIGAGRLGTILAVALQRAGWPVTIVARGARSAARATDRGLRVLRSTDSAPRSDIVLLCVPDDAIASTAFAEASAPDTPAAGAIVLHTSGAVPVTALDALAMTARATGCLHPLQTVTAESESDALHGAPAAITGSAEARDAAERIAVAVGLAPFALADDAKPLYHAASAMAANLTVGLLDAAILMAVAAGMPDADARRALPALARTALDRMLQHGAESALTGPIRRGDAGTVRAHLDAMHRQVPELVPLYIHAARQTLALARRAGLAGESADAVAQTLDRPVDA